MAYEDAIVYDHDQEAYKLAYQPANENANVHSCNQKANYLAYKVANSAAHKVANSAAYKVANSTSIQDAHGMAN